MEKRKKGGWELVGGASNGRIVCCGKKLSMTFTSPPQSWGEGFRLKISVYNDQHKHARTCCCKLILTPFVLLYLVQCHSLVGVGDEDFPDEAEHEGVEFAPRRHACVLVLLPRQILLASNRRLVPGQLFKEKKKSFSFN